MLIYFASVTYTLIHSIRSSVILANSRRGGFLSTFGKYMYALRFLKISYIFLEATVAMSNGVKSGSNSKRGALKGNYLL